MNINIELISTVNMTNDEWLNYRYSGIGASEVSSILGLNQYKSSIELFYEKIGYTQRYNIENMACFMGKEQEAFVADLWKYWDGSQESMILNYRANKIVRKCQRVNAYARNPKYPHLFVSLDRKINKHGNKEEGALEIKTMGGYEANKWEAGIPIGHIMQLQTQLQVCEFDYGELAILTDGRQFDVYPFDKVQGICDTIVERTHLFWQRVEKAKVLVNQKFEFERNFNMVQAEKVRAEIESYEPEADGSDAYTKFLKEKYKNAKLGGRLGNDAEKQFAINSKNLAEQIKILEEEKNKNENLIKKSMGEIQTLDFGSSGKVHWTLDAKGGRRFSNKIKL